MLRKRIPIRPGRLDSRETTVDPNAEEDLDQEWRFRNCRSARACLIASLPDLGLSPRAQAAVARCGKSAWVVRDKETGRHWVQAETCQQRFCPACARTRARKASEKIAGLMAAQSVQRWQFVTLTMLHSHAPLERQLKNLVASFRRLRQTRLWRTHVAQSLAVVEITRNSQTDEWHPHLHVIAATQFVPWKPLRDAWNKASKGAKVIDCAIMNQTTAAIEYVTSYLGKPPSVDVMVQSDLLAEWITATRGARMVIKAGRWERPQKPQQTEAKKRAEHKSVAPLKDVIRNARMGHAESLAILAAIAGVSRTGTELEREIEDVWTRWAEADARKAAYKLVNALGP
jgi:hypothetical protein